jgi:hypothetical protein
MKFCVQKVGDVARFSRSFEFLGFISSPVLRRQHACIQVEMITGHRTMLVNCVQ